MKMIVCWEWEENTGGRGARCCCAGPRDHYASCKMTRLPFALSHRPYVFEGVDEGGRWYNGSRRMDGRRGLSVPHVWTSQHNGNPFFGLRTNGQIRRRPTSPWKSLVRVRLRNNKTTAAPARRRQRERQNSATLQPDHRWSSGALKPRGDSQDTRIFGGNAALNDVPDEFRGSSTAKIDLIFELARLIIQRVNVTVGREVSYYKLRQ